MNDIIDPQPSSDLVDSFGKFSRSRKAHQNTRVIADMVYARLRELILSAELRPNRRLVEDDLAEWLNVSRTPIREALLSLEKEGLVERNRGWIIREHNPAEVKARLECRLAIESYAARLAAARRTDTDLQELRILADAMEKPGLSTIEFNELNDRFHKIVTEAADNPTLTYLHSQTKMNYWDLSVPVIFSTNMLQNFYGQHHALIDALKAGDGDKAQSIAENHILTTMEIVFDALQMKDRVFSP